jgi:ATP-dependent Clp protease ATP-binding subunit ClpA
MFERFTDQSRRVVVLAQEEARRLDHNYIGTEHLLLGLLRERRGAAGRALASAEVTVEAVREQVETLVGRGQTAPSGHIPFTGRAKRCLELALREAMKLGHSYIGTGHLLLGLTSVGDGTAVRVLGAVGGDLAYLRSQVIAEIEDQPEQPYGSYWATPVVSPFPAPPRQRRVQLPEAVDRLLEEIEGRLSAIERHLGIIPPEADEAGTGEDPGG